MRSGKVDEADLPVHADVGRRHQPVVDAVDQDEHDLDDEHEAEEEREPAQRFLPGALEARVVDAVDDDPQHEEDGRHDDAGQHGIEAVPGAEQIGEVGADDDEGRVGDVDDVELAEGDRQTERHGGVETTEQQARDDSVQEQSGIDNHCRRGARRPLEPAPRGATPYCLYGKASSPDFTDGG